MTDREQQLKKEIEQQFSIQFLAEHTREFQAYQNAVWHPEDAVETFDRERGVVSIVFTRKGCEHMRFTVSAEEFAAERWPDVQMWLQHGQYVGQNWISHLTTCWGDEFDRIMEGPNGREIVSEAAKDYVQALGWHLGLDQRVHNVDGATILGGEEPPQRFESAAKPKPKPGNPNLLNDMLERIEAIEALLGITHG